MAYKIKTTRFIETIDILDGKITFDGLDLDENIPLSDQVDALREDMLQIKYRKRFTLDVGWRPELDPNGYFLVLIIQDTDWLNPIQRTECHTLAELKTALECAAKLIHEKLKIKNLPYRDVEYDEYD